MWMWKYNKTPENFNQKNILNVLERANNSFIAAAVEVFHRS